MCIARTSFTGTLDTLSLVIYSWELVRITPSSNTICLILSRVFEKIFCQHSKYRFSCSTGPELGHALANFALQGYLRKTAVTLCFSKVPAGSDCPPFRTRTAGIYLLYDFRQVFISVKPFSLQDPAQDVVFQSVYFNITVQTLTSVDEFRASPHIW